MKHLICVGVSALVLFSASGCAPARLVDGIGYAAQRYRVRDASTLLVRNRGHLRFDAALRSDLDDALASPDLAEVTSRGVDVLGRANALAINAVNRELDRISAEGLAFLADTYHLERAPGDVSAKRARIKAEYGRQSQMALVADVNQLRAARDIGSARSLLRRVQRGIEPPAGDRGRLGRVLLAAPLYLPVRLGAEIADAEAAQRVVIADFERVVEYHPADTDKARSALELENGDEEALARWFAPIFVQQIDSQAPYPKSEDRIGRVYLTGARDRIEVNVATDDPVVYWRRQQAKIGTRKYEQLVYAAWYPSRPPLRPGDPEAGRIDGVVVRITLDRHHRPAVYEFVRSCGCYHTLWVAEFVEAAARRQYGEPGAGRTYAAQERNAGRELFFPALVPDDGARPRRPIAYVSAGRHMLMGVKPAGDTPHEGKVVAKHTYRLEKYETLTALPLGDGVASMFGSDGLVHNAGRQEGWLLAPTGMLSAGQPRQLGTMKIRMDAYDYDDPRLLERHLRFPTGF